MPVSPDGQEPLSPELILVAPPDEAQAARERLEDAPGSEWDEFLARVRAQPEPPAAVETVAEPVERPERRRSRRPLLVAGVTMLVVSLVVGIAWIRDRAQQQAAQPPPPATTSHASTNPVGPAPRKHQPTRETTRAAPKRTRSTAPTPPTKRTAGFVPSRVWSWPASPSSSRYLVRFFRNGQRVLAVRTARPRLVLPKRFTFRAGRYRWTVVPISSRGKQRRPLVDSTFVVSG